MSQSRSLEWVEYTRVEAEVTRAKERVLIELELSIVINGEYYTTAMITPMMEYEFVTGYLFGQGIIENFDEIKAIKITGNIAEVTLHNTESKRGNREKDLKRIDSDLKITEEDIFEAINAILKSEIYAETGAIHSAGLFKQGTEPVCITEDIGRHNALDKVIGYALINKIDFKNTFITSTGRMVAEMVSKVCRANIPIVATKAAVTKLGIDIGDKYGLTIIGFVRDKGTKIESDTGETITTERLMKIYTHPERIII